MEEEVSRINVTLIIKLMAEGGIAKEQMERMNMNMNMKSDLVRHFPRVPAGAQDRAT
jgi:hypothetical protein